LRLELFTQSSFTDFLREHQFFIFFWLENFEVLAGSGTAIAWQNRNGGLSRAEAGPQVAAFLCGFPSGLSGKREIPAGALAIRPAAPGPGPGFPQIRVQK
jgi:hypothetical protein